MAGGNVEKVWPRAHSLYFFSRGGIRRFPSDCEDGYQNARLVSRTPRYAISFNGVIFMTASMCIPLSSPDSHRRFLPQRTSPPPPAHLYRLTPPAGSRKERGCALCVKHSLVISELCISYLLQSLRSASQ